MLRSGKTALGAALVGKGRRGLGGDLDEEEEEANSSATAPGAGQENNTRCQQLGVGTHSPTWADPHLWGRGQGGTKPAGGTAGGGMGMGSALRCSARPRQLSPGCINSTSYKSTPQPSRRAGQASCPPRDINNRAVCSVTMARPPAPRCDGTGDAAAAPQRHTGLLGRALPLRCPPVRWETAAPAALVRHPTAEPHTSPRLVAADASHGAATRPTGGCTAQHGGLCWGPWGQGDVNATGAQTRAEGGSEREN